MNFEGDYLRVITPVIGPSGQVVIQNGRVVSRENSLPLTARRGLEEENDNFRRAGRPELIHQIEIVKCDPIHIPDTVDMGRFGLSFMAGAKPTKATEPIKPLQPAQPSKRGRPKKVKS